MSQDIDKKADSIKLNQLDNIKYLDLSDEALMDINELCNKANNANFMDLDDGLKGSLNEKAETSLDNAMCGLFTFKRFYSWLTHIHLNRPNHLFLMDIDKDKNDMKKMLDFNIYTKKFTFLFGNKSDDILLVNVEESTNEILLSYSVPIKKLEKNEITNKYILTDDTYYCYSWIKESKITQKDISAQLGFSSVSFISRLERGDMQSIKHEDVQKLAACLGINVDKLLLGSEKIN